MIIPIPQRRNRRLKEACQDHRGSKRQNQNSKPPQQRGQGLLPSQLHGEGQSRRKECTLFSRRMDPSRLAVDLRQVRGPHPQHSWTSEACSPTSQLMREGAKVGRGERTMLGGDSELSWHL